MILSKIKYSRTYMNDSWCIGSGENNTDALELSNINLIVGQNASGKSSTIAAIRTLADLLAGDVNLQNLVHDTACYDVEFADGTSTLNYCLEFKDGRVTKEQLLIDGKIHIDRAKSQMLNATTGDMDKTGTEDYLLLAARRDPIQNPYLDKLFQWGKNQVPYSFAGDLGQKMLAKDTSLILKQKVNPKHSEQVIAAFLQGRQNNSAYYTTVLDEFRNLGYEISDIEVRNIKRTDIEGSGVTVKEKCLNTYTDQTEMSQGMFRALSLIIQIEYALISGTPSCILIDDIGEGLDYERAHKLIKLIQERVEGSNVQVIMTTNDRFVMNAIDIRYWHVVYRSGSTVRFVNSKNSPEVFDTFALMGLNNFEFFQSKFFKGINVTKG